jgi:hypothetical protein
MVTLVRAALVIITMTMKLLLALKTEAQVLIRYCQKLLIVFGNEASDFFLLVAHC